MGLEEMGLESVDWMHLLQDRDHWQALSGCINGGGFLD
jgi:hypothetical protein